MDVLKRKVIDGARWTSLYQYLNLGLNFFGGIYLARMIAPEIYGRVGLMTATIGLVTMAAMWGFLAAIMKRAGDVKDNMEYLGTLLTIQVGLSGLTLIALIIVALIFPEKFGFMLIFMTIAAAPMVLTATYRGTLVKDFLYRTWFIIHIVPKILSMAVACFLAYWGFGLWALILKYAIDCTGTGLLTFWLVPHRVKFVFNKEMAKDFFNFGKFAFIGAMLEGGYTTIDRISLGSWVGAAALGFYERAQNLASYIHTAIFDAISSVFISLFGELKEDKARLTRAYNFGCALFFRIYLIFFLWLGLLTPEAVRILYGPHWLAMVPIFRLLTPFLVLTSLRQLNRLFQLNLGHSRVVAKIQAIESSVLVVLLIPLIILLKVQGVVVALDISVIVGVSLFFSHAQKLVDVDWKGIFGMPLVVGFLILLSFGLWRVMMGDMMTRSLYTYGLLASIFILLAYVILSAIFEFGFWKEVYRLVKVKR